MKKIVFVGLVLIGSIFQNCKNNKQQQDVLISDGTENEVKKKVDTSKILDTVVAAKEEISSTIETEEIKDTTQKTKRKTNPVTKEAVKIIKKKAVKTTPKDIPILKEEKIKKEIIVIKEVDTITKTKKIPVATPEKVVKREAETIIESKIKKPKTVTSPNNWLVPAKYENMKNPTDPSEDLAIGRSLYSKHCKSCHGKEGYGDGPKADEMEGELGDFSTEEFQAQSDGTLFYKSTFGRDDMPEYTKKMPDDEDRWLIVNYLRTLAE